MKQKYKIKKIPTKDEIRKAFMTVFYGENCKWEDKSQIIDMKVLNPDLKDKVLSGYHYKIDTGSTVKVEGRRNITIHAGYGGINLYIDECRKQGMSDSLTACSIFVLLDDNQWYPLSQLTVKKVENEKGS